jgi:hypothetical protein
VAGTVFTPAVMMVMVVMAVVVPTVVRAVPRVGGVGAGGENAHHEDERRQEPRQYLPPYAHNGIHHLPPHRGLLDTNMMPRHDACVLYGNASLFLCKGV